MTLEWVRDAVFYKIFPDRFARSQSESVTASMNFEPWDSPPTSNGFKGGNLAGILEHLEHLIDLGVTALYLTPVFQSTANHRYHTCDYYAIDPILGGNAAFRIFLDECHHHGIRVILDGVFNHTGRGFFQFNHIVENGSDSPYLDWFHVRNLPIQPYTHRRGRHGYKAWWDIPALPKLNVGTPAVRGFLLDVAGFWIERGIDGWRLDVPEEIAVPGFWQDFRRKVKAINGDAYLLGEIWHEAPDWLRGDRFDAVMNYPLARACLGFFAAESLSKEVIARCAFRRIEPLKATEFADEIERLLALYPPEVMQLQFNLLDSHDTPRFITMAGSDRSAYRLAILFLMTFPGAPCIYYGDEIGMEGGHDPDCRRGFIWNQSNWDLEHFNFVREAVKLRRESPSLRRGSFTILKAEDAMLCYSRRTEEETIIVLLNTALETRTMAIPFPTNPTGFDNFHVIFPSSRSSEDRQFPKFIPASKESNDEAPMFRVTVPSRSGIVLKNRP